MATIDVAPRQAERRPERKPVVNDFSVQVATVNGSGSQSANMVLLRTIFQMGVPVSGKNLFPSNIAGLPTWFTIRASKDGYIARKKEIDFLVCMNPETAQDDVMTLAPGAAVLYDEPLQLSKLRKDLTFYAVPYDKLVAAVCPEAKLRKLVKNMVYVGAVAQLLNLDPSTRLKPVDGWVVPAPVVPDPVPLPELLAIALMQRPELAARRSEVRTALYELSLARVLPFSPNVIMGFSAGGFGGGSNLVSSPEGFVTGTGQRVVDPRFGNLETRSDFDVVVFWQFRNMGVGNVALIRAADSRVRQTRLREVETLNTVRSEVAEAKARVEARSLRIAATEKAVRSATAAYTEDLIRIKGGQGLPLEVVDSLRLLARSRYEYLDAIIDYNRAQFQLWVALGRPPADCLARPVPADLVPPPAVELKPGPRVFPMPRTLPLPTPGKP